MLLSRLSAYRSLAASANVANMSIQRSSLESLMKFCNCAKACPLRIASSDKAMPSLIVAALPAM
ncbi:hypothetical protein SDC9_186313 [bioreactor metagenome]|uniref:Uncharacterized protein n=1 Tax=bioreactor metagenome TaxID=1076179 RepID=A0A645HIE1_9ZZZZ